jgi:PII-like signaling protein
MSHEKFEGERTLMRIHIGESDKWHGKPLHEAIVELVRKEGFSGATVLRGVGGFGGSSTYHTDKILRLSQDLPIVVEIVEYAERIEKILPRLDEMVEGGLITLEKVRVILYRSAKNKESEIFAQIPVNFLAPCPPSRLCMQA